MITVSKNVSASGRYQILGPAPSGSRYIITGATTTAGKVQVNYATTSGNFVTVASTFALTNITYYPSGQQGFGEALEIRPTTKCNVTVSYILQAPQGSMSAYNVFDAHSWKGRQQIENKWGS